MLYNFRQHPRGKKSLVIRKKHKCADSEVKFVAKKPPLSAESVMRMTIAEEGVFKE
jgi:hypothetical protein